MAYKVILSKQACKDLEKLKNAGLARQAKSITVLLGEDPYRYPPSFEKLLGELHGIFSRRINIQHRYVYRILANDVGEKDEGGNLYEGFVHVLRMWTHYE